MNSRTNAAPIALSTSAVLVAFVAGVIVAALVFVMRASIAALVESSAFIPVACVLGALSVRAIESLVGTLVRGHKLAQRSGTA